MRTYSYRSAAICVAALTFCILHTSVGYAQQTRLRTPAARLKLPAATSEATHRAAGASDLASNEPNRQFDEEIDRHFAEKKIPGLVVLYARDGMLVYKRSKGHADVGSNTTMNEHKVSRLNSVSKWVGTIVQLKLEEQGKLNLKTKARDYLSDLPAHHTYRLTDLLACRSGVRHYGEPSSPDSPKNWSEDDFAEASDAIANFWLDPLASPVGEYHYSTFGYSIADACAEQATSKSFKQLVKSLVSTPANAPTLGVEDLETPNAQRVSYYTVKNGQNVKVAPPKKEWCPSGGGMESTPLDLLKVGIALCDGKLISQQNVKRMMTRVDPFDSYALGCSHAVENGYHVMAKDGSAEGSNAYIWLVPERRMVMVIMANRDDAGVSSLGKTLRNIALGTEKAAGELPDLIVRDFERTAAPRYKDGNLEIPVTFYVNNRGGAGTSVKFVNSVRVDGKDRWTGFMDALPRASYKTVTATVKIADPNKLLAGRTLQLEAYADAPIAAADTSIPAHGRVKEENDNNNAASFTVTVPGGLDLKADAAAIPTAQKPSVVRPSGAEKKVPVRVPTRLVRPMN